MAARTRSAPGACAAAARWLGGAVALGLGLAASLPGRAAAEEWEILGARYHGLGGAGVAIAFDADAVDWNPGSLAFATHTEEVSLRGSLSAAAEGGFLENAGDVVDFVDATGVDRSIRRLRQGGSLSEEETRDALALFVEHAPGLVPNGQGAQVLADSGLVLRRGGFVLSSRVWGFAGLDTRLDLRSFALGADGIDVGQLVGAGSDRSGEFQNPGSASLAEALAQSGSVTQEQASELVFQAEQAGIDTSAAGPRSLLTGLASNSGEPGGGSSGVRVQGLYVKQFGIGYGFPLVEGVLGVGAHLKYMHGTTVYEFIGVDASGDTERSDASPRRRSREWGLDLGMLYQPTQWLRFGLSVRNLNKPSFKTAGSRDEIALKPQVRAGFALQIHPRVQIAADLDLTENQYETIDGFKSQVLATGLEFRSRFRRWAVDLRVGAQRNFARGSDKDLTLTCGMGLHVRASRYDLAFSYGLGGEDVERVGVKIPRRADVAGGLRWVREF
jgi:hypothetical protein